MAKKDSDVLEKHESLKEFKYSQKELSKESLFSLQWTMLLKEIDNIQQNITAYDVHSFRIKGWAVTLWTAAVAWGVIKKTPEFVFLSLLIIFVFWFLDAVYKTHKRRFRLRMEQIIDFFNNRKEYEGKGLVDAIENQSFGDFPFFDPVCVISKNKSPTFKAYYKRKKKLWRCFWYWNISFVYIGLTIATIIVCLIIIFRIPIVGQTG